MPKKQKTKQGAGAVEASGKIETAYVIVKYSLVEWQIVELKILDGQVIKRTEREPNLSEIVRRQLIAELRRDEA